jgi:hypothetical protein
LWPESGLLVAHRLHALLAIATCNINLISKVSAMKKRHKKVRDKERRRAQLRDRRWIRYEELLDWHGLANGFRALPSRLREWFWQHRYPHPEVVIGPSAADCPRSTEVKAALEEVLTLPFAESTTPVTTTDFLSIYLSLLPCFRSFEALPEAHISAAYRDRALAAFGNFFESRVQRVLEELDGDLHKVCVWHTRIDEGFFWHTMDLQELADGRLLLRVELEWTRPEQIDVCLDGAPRPAFRSGTVKSDAGVTWACWPGAVLGLPATTATLPVYVQSHALHRLRERLPVDGCEQLLHMELGQSLDSPVLVKHREETLLVEYRVAGYRFGYLTARRLEDKIIITSFLFVTMEGTPEADALRRKLRLRRPDIEFHQLDRLETFLTTDLREDATLVALLTECGCGHLITLSREIFAELRGQGFAQDLRRYLGMADAQAPDSCARSGAQQAVVAS